MLDHELAQAQASRTSQHKRIVLTLLSILLVSLLAYAVYSWWQVSNWFEPESPAASQPTANSQKASTQTVIDEIDQTLLAGKSDDELRQAFKALIQTYQAVHQPSLDQIKQGTWQSEQIIAIENNHQQSLALFAQGEYRQAIPVATRVNQEAQSATEAWQQAFDKALNGAQQAFAARKANEAELLVSEALAIIPDDPQALKLQQRLTVLAEVNQLLEDYQIAKTENNLMKQVELLERVLALDPERQALAEDLALVKETLRQQKLSEIVEQGLAAVSNGQLASAQQSLKRAKAIAISKEETTYLSQQVAILTIQTQQANGHLAIAKLIEQDNWAQVVPKAQAFVKQFETQADAKPSLTREVKTWLTTAQQLVQVNRQVKGLLAKPQRLQDDGVRAHAKGIIEAHGVETLQSLKFTEDMLALEQLVNDLEIEVNVAIESDGETYIVLLGRGNIGKTTGRSIALRPGQYIFEGRRQGYRNVRVSLEVAAGKDPLSIKVVCNERI